jgi:DnaJ-domain-containing protein 1
LSDAPLVALRTLPFIGPVTQFHLAKNIGLDVAKPDRHLVRIAQLFQFASVQDLCETIANQAGTRVAVVDLVFWRFATLNRRYLEALRQFV